MSGRSRRDSDPEPADDEWYSDTSPVTYSPDDDSADDFIVFADESNPDDSDSDAALWDVPDTDEEELNTDACDLCRESPTGTCTDHQRIIQANIDFDNWYATVPSKPRTCKVCPMLYTSARHISYISVCVCVCDMVRAAHHMYIQNVTFRYVHKMTCTPADRASLDRCISSPMPIW